MHGFPAGLCRPSGAPPLASSLPSCVASRASSSSCLPPSRTLRSRRRIDHDAAESRRPGRVLALLRGADPIYVLIELTECLAVWMATHPAIPAPREYAAEFSALLSEALNDDDLDELTAVHFDAWADYCIGDAPAGVQ